MFFVDEGFTYRNFLMDMIAVFAFVVWFWLLIVIYGDLFRRHDISGWGKALWVLALVLTSYLGIVAYLVTQGKGMGGWSRCCHVWSRPLWKVCCRRSDHRKPARMTQTGYDHCGPTAG